MDLERAIHAPRMHFEDYVWCMKGSFSDGEVEAMTQPYPNLSVAVEANILFEAHSVTTRSGTKQGICDLYRAGVCQIV